MASLRKVSVQHPSNTEGRSELDLYDTGRKTVLTGLAVAFVGASVGLFVNVWFGLIPAAESVVIASCAVMAFLLIVLLIKPNPVSPRSVAAAAGVYFSIYLLAGAAAVIWDTSEFARLIPYLMWYYPLLAFNKFTTSGRPRFFLDVVISVCPSIVLLAYCLVHGRQGGSDALALVWASFTAFTAYAIFLSRFSGYREAIADQRARSQEVLKAAQALEENEQLYQRMLSDAGAGIGMMSAHEVILWANDKVSEWTGRQEVGGLKFDELVGHDDLQGWRAGIARLLSGEIAKYEHECSIVPVGAPPRAIQSTFLRAPKREAQQQPAIIFICFDISELRDLDLQLRQSQKMEALGRLTGGIAHDFNNLLTVILGSSEALTYRLEGRGEEQELAEVIEAAAERASGLVRHLLAFSQKQALAPQPTDVRKLIDTAAALMQRVLPESITLEVSHSAEVGQTLLDPGQFESALLNLVVNARDAMPQGGHLKLATQAVSFPSAEDYPLMPRGEYVLVTVTDNGEGMDEETLTHVFEPFFSTKGAGKGSGLGLSMVYGFIKQSGGEIQIVSAQGAGTEVRLFFPRMSLPG